MTYLGVTSRFRRRMLPLVLFSLVLVAAAAPTAFYLQKRHELYTAARADAARAATVLRGEMERGPLLWRYRSVKLAERFAAEGLRSDQVAALVVHDAAGVGVPCELRPGAPAPPPARLLWARAAVVIAGQLQATVWIGVDQRPLWLTTATLSGVFLVLSVLLASVLYVVPVRAVAAAEARVAALLARLALTLKEEERRRIAQDLHDGAGQALTAARLHLLALHRSDPTQEAAIAAIGRHLDEALDEVRRSTQALAPPALAELGLHGALTRHCESFARATGLRVVCEAPAELRLLPAAVETASYRVIQEALTNIARHAGASAAQVRLWLAEGALHLTVSDDGVGMKDAAAGPSRGLLGIRERAEMLGGSVRFVPGEGWGTRVEVVFPLRPGESA